MTTTFLLVLITSLALKSTCSAVWVVQIISRQLSKWKLILSTPVHHPDSASNTGRKINMNKNISKALALEVLQLEIIPQFINHTQWQQYYPVQNAPAVCCFYHWASKFKKRIMLLSWASWKVTTCCRPLIRLMVGVYWEDVLCKLTPEERRFFWWC